MPTEKSNSPSTGKLDSWLRASKFSLGNPFATTEASQERNLLPDFFVDVDGYEQIKGDRTVITFAPRGGGKSALRIVLASYAAPVLPDAEVLAVEYINFSQFLLKIRSGEKITIDDYVDQLLRAGTEALFFTLFGYSPNKHHSNDEPEIRRRRIKRITHLIPPTRSRIAQWIRNYSPVNMRPEELYERLRAIKLAFSPDWRKFSKAVSTQKLKVLIEQSPLVDDEMANLLAELNDFSIEEVELLTSPLEKISNFVALTRSCGFKYVQFLIDGVDETIETANNPETQADILEPLLAELRILESPNVAFKFFLSREAHKEILERPTIRRDRLTDRALTVEWTEEKLKALLDARLDYFSNHAVQELIQICQDTMMESERRLPSSRMGEWIEREMLRSAKGSPRRLLTAGQLLFEAHVSHQNIKELIELDDWECAKKELDRKMPLPLLTSPDLRKAWVGESEVELTALNHKILIALATAVNGVCERDQLAFAAWGSKQGVTPQAIDKAVSRLRELLGDDPDDPIYLKTIRGKGVQ
ncbi:MAG: winged helix-turn-helix transcriptional regulator, partial [Anaerolineales bacterium]|nr:winged helix-turn-helix transcriptional regulator [Anaerolineales bacterium]